MYMSIGDILIFSDFNSRTKTLPDFIVNDEVHESVVDNNLQYSWLNSLILLVDTLYAILSLSQTMHHYLFNLNVLHC